MAARTVTIVCANGDTLRELVTYLESAGLEVRARTTMTTVGLEHPTSSVVVFFPDEFPSTALAAEIERLREDAPHVVCVIVTKHPGHFAEVDKRTVVIPKPAWGWTILDAIHMRSND